VKNYYSVLGISRFADQDAIRHAFRAQVRRNHPDVGVGSSPEKFREAVEAYEVLSDPSRRREYDQMLAPLHVVRAEPLIPSQGNPRMRIHAYSQSVTLDPFEAMGQVLQDLDSYFDFLFTLW
jgi:curved DNA-binding protein CbpA